jgi:hypothetical protein
MDASAAASSDTSAATSAGNFKHLNSVPAARLAPPAKRAPLSPEQQAAALAAAEANALERAREREQERLRLRSARAARAEQAARAARAAAAAAAEAQQHQQPQLQQQLPGRSTFGPFSHQQQQHLQQQQQQQYHAVHISAPLLLSADFAGPARVTHPSGLSTLHAALLSPPGQALLHGNSSSSGSSSGGGNRHQQQQQYHHHQQQQQREGFYNDFASAAGLSMVSGQPYRVR